MSRVMLLQSSQDQQQTLLLDIIFGKVNIIVQVLPNRSSYNVQILDGSDMGKEGTVGGWEK